MTATDSPRKKFAGKKKIRGLLVRGLAHRGSKPWIKLMDAVKTGANAPQGDPENILEIVPQRAFAPYPGRSLHMYPGRLPETREW